MSKKDSNEVGLDSDRDRKKKEQDKAIIKVKEKDSLSCQMSIGDNTVAVGAIADGKITQEVVASVIDENVPKHRNGMALVPYQNESSLCLQGVHLENSVVSDRSMWIDDQDMTTEDLKAVMEFVEKQDLPDNDLTNKVEHQKKEKKKSLKDVIAKSKIHIFDFAKEVTLEEFMQLTQQRQVVPERMEKMPRGGIKVRFHTVQQRNIIKESLEEIEGLIIKKKNSFALMIRGVPDWMELPFRHYKRIGYGKVLIFVDTEEEAEALQKTGIRFDNMSFPAIYKKQVCKKCNSMKHNELYCTNSKKLTKIPPRMEDRKQENKEPILQSWKTQNIPIDTRVIELVIEATIACLQTMNALKIDDASTQALKKNILTQTYAKFQENKREQELINPQIQKKTLPASNQQNSELIVVPKQVMQPNTIVLTEINSRKDVKKYIQCSCGVGYNPQQGFAAHIKACSKGGIVTCVCGKKSNDYNKIYDFGLHTQRCQILEKHIISQNGQ